jgi:hypothetical protein
MWGPLAGTAVGLIAAMIGAFRLDPNGIDYSPDLPALGLFAGTFGGAFIGLLIGSVCAVFCGKSSNAKKSTLR